MLSFSSNTSLFCCVNVHYEVHGKLIIYNYTLTPLTVKRTRAYIAFKSYDKNRVRRKCQYYPLRERKSSSFGS